MSVDTPSLDIRGPLTRLAFLAGGLSQQALGAVRSIFGSRLVSKGSMTGTAMQSCSKMVGSTPLYALRKGMQKKNEEEEEEEGHLKSSSIFPLPPYRFSL